MLETYYSFHPVIVKAFANFLTHHADDDYSRAVPGSSLLPPAYSDLCEDACPKTLEFEWLGTIPAFGMVTGDGMFWEEGR